MPNVLSNLTPALIQTFLTILVGYVFGRLKWMTPAGMGAMGMFVSNLSLPALLLRNMATLDLSSIEWNFFFAFLISKAILFLSVVVLLLLKRGCTKRGMSDAGAFAIFVTQSNDFAMGLPILDALFSVSQPTFPKLLYVISPISLIILNPIGFFLMQSGRETTTQTLSSDEAANGGGSLDDKRRASKSPALQRIDFASSSHQSSSYEPPSFIGSASPVLVESDLLAPVSESEPESDSDSERGQEIDAIELAGDQDGDSSFTMAASSPAAPSPLRGFLLVLYRVMLNPVVLCSFLGIIANFAFNGTVPSQIDSFLLALGNCFSALSLFVLGVNMNGKLALFQDRRQLFGPLLMICAKTIVLPVIIRLVITALGVDGRSDLTMCAFLVGTLPTAPSVPFFASEFGAHSHEIIGPAMVLGTFVAAPIMFISAQMTTVAITMDTASTILSDTTRIAAGFGCVAVAYCIGCFIYNRRWRSTRERLLLTLCACQLIYTFVVQLCVLDFEVDSARAAVRMSLVLASEYGVYISAAMMSINEIVRRVHGSHVERTCYKWYNLCGALLLICLVGGLHLFGHRADPELEFYRCWDRFGQGQYIVNMTLLCVCAVISVAGLMQLRSASAVDGQATTSDETTTALHDHLLPGGVSLDSSLTTPIPLGSSGHMHVRNDSFSFQAPIPRFRTSTALGDGGWASLNQPSGLSRATSGSHAAAAAAASGSSTPHGMRSPPPTMIVLPASKVESFWLFSMQTQLFLMAASLFFRAALAAWSDDTNGVRIEIALLDAVLFAGMGVYTFALFGCTKNIVSPMRPVSRVLRRWWRRVMRRIRTGGTRSRATAAAATQSYA